MKILWLVGLFFIGFSHVQAETDLYISGTKVSAGCEKITSGARFQYSNWFSECPARSKVEAYAFLQGRNYFTDTLPECSLPNEAENQPGMRLSQEVPDGYELLDVNITSSKRSYYHAYLSEAYDFTSHGGFWIESFAILSADVYTDGVRFNDDMSVVHGYCNFAPAGNCTQAALSYTADVYDGVIHKESFIQHYRRTCDVNDTDFSEINTNEETAFEWRVPEDRTTECSEVNGTVQERVQDCNAAYRCVVKTCTDPDIAFPAVAQNERILYKWQDPQDRSAECTQNKGTAQEARESCEMQYRCIQLTDGCPDEANEPISSYVSPRDGVFHEDIEVTGANFELHYSSANLNNTTIAHGWSISSHARLVGDRVYYGSGSIRVVDTSVQEGNFTVILSGGNVLLFDTDGQLQSIRNLYTKETKTIFGYDNMGRLTTITDMYGQISHINRDPNGTVMSIVTSRGQRTYLSVDDNGDLLEVQYEDTASYAFEYERHLMIVETEPKGNRFLHFFDDAGNVVKVIDAEQGEWDFASNTADSYGSHTVTRASGDIIVYKNHFLENNTTLRTEKLLPTGDVIKYSNSIDDSMSSTKSCGMTTTNLYKTNPDGSLFKDVYTAKRVLESSTVVTPSGLTNNTLFTKAYTLKQDGTLKRIVNTSTTNTKTSTHIKNFKRHRDISISPLAKRTHIQYDPQMKQPLEVKPYGLHKTTYTYNPQGKVIQETTGNRTTIYSYDAKGNLATTTDPLQHTTSYTYDSRDRLIQTTYADGSVEYYDYDANSNPIKRTVPTPADHTFSYNGVNKRTLYTSPEQKQTTYTYDKQRRVIQITKPSGKTINTTYTNARVTSIQTDEGTTDYSYACQSNVSQISKGSESFSFTYDGTLLTSISQTGQLNQTIDYTYNNDFNPISMTYAGQTENYTYNDDNEPTQIGTYTITRKQKNRKIILSDGNYKQITKLNRYGELHRQQDNTIKVRLKRNKLGQIVKKVEKLQGQRKKVYRYTYDERGRLTEVKERRHIVESYIYDSNGNRQSATVNGTTVTASYTLDDNLVVYGDNTYLYDDDGYLTEKTTPNGTTMYSYGTLGELKEVTTTTSTGSVTVSYKQNANNQRVAKLIDGVVVEKYLWANLTTLLAIYDANDNLVQRFEYADQRMPVAMTDANNTKYYLHYDQVGSLRSVTDTSHNIVKEITYDTFGNILTDTNPSLKVPFGFAGGLYDSDTKLTRFGYRDYDAYTGKWTAKDPIGFSGGDSNLYGYVLGDPVRGFDPSGLVDENRIPTSDLYTTPEKSNNYI